MLDLKVLAEINAERIARGEAVLTVAQVEANIERGRALTAAAKARHEDRMANDELYRNKINAAGKAGKAFGMAFKKA